MMFKSEIFFTLKNITNNKEFEITELNKICGLIYNHIITNPLFSNFFEEVEILVSLENEIDIFGSSTDYSNIEKQNFRSNYFLKDHYSFRSLVLNSNLNATAVSNYPFFVIKLKHENEITNVMDYFNVLDKLSMYFRIITNSCLKFQDYYFKSSDIDARYNIQNIFTEQFSFPDDSMLYSSNQFCDYKDISSITDDILENVSKLIGGLNQGEESTKIDMRKIYQSFYSFGEDTIDMNITILVTLLESLIPSFKSVPKIDNAISKFEKEGKKLSTYKTFEIVFSELFILSKLSILSTILDIRNVFSHGHRFIVPRLESEINKFLETHKNKTKSDYYIHMRGETFNLLHILLEKLSKTDSYSIDET